MKNCKRNLKGANDNMDIKEKMHGIEAIDKNKSIKDVSFILENYTPDALLILEKGKIIGILTDTDLLIKVKKDDIYSESIKVKDIMSSPVITIDSNKSIQEAINLMLQYNIKKLPVMENGHPIGILYGEEILELDEEKWKEIVFKQTIEEVFKLLLREPKIDRISVLNIVRRIDKFVDMNSKTQFDLFTYQEGIALVAYNYIKENPRAPLQNIMFEIRKNYSSLLEKYSQEEEDKLEKEEQY